MKRYILFIVCLFTAIQSFCSDSLNTLSAKQLLLLVKQYHPVARIAETDIAISKAEITTAQGGFDPVFQYKTGQKTFDNISYYRENTPEIRIPTWYGIELTAGTVNLTGNRVNPEETAGATSFAGISVPLAKNLLMDKRRAALQEARIMNRLAVNEQKNVLNNLYYEALNSYWQWVQSWQVYRVTDEAVQVNEKRLTLVKKAWQQGERPAIDTVEAYTQWQSFLYLRNEAQLAIQNAAVNLSAFLWKQGNQPADLPETVQPAANTGLLTEETPVPVLQTLLDMATMRHPELLSYGFKLQYLEVEKKLKFQELLPSVRVQYNQLGKGYQLGKTAAQWPLFDNNFRYGVSVAVPLRLSEGRGEYRKAKLKISATELARSQKELLVQNKVKAVYNEYSNLNTQLRLQESLYRNYERLLKGEETRFFNGESSLFLVNSREQKLLEARQKLLEVQVKLQKTRFALYWAAGILADQV